MAYRANVALKFQLLSTAVNVETAMRDEDSLATICCGTDEAHDPTRVKQPPLKCPVCSKEGTHFQFQKGVEAAGGYKVFTADEVADAKAVSPEVKNEINLTAHLATEVAASTMVGGKTYYLAPATKGYNPEGYAALLAVVRSNPEIAFCTRWAGRTKAATYRLGAHGDVLTITQLATPQMVVAAPSVPLTDVDETAVALLNSWVQTSVKPFVPADYASTFQTRLDELLGEREVVAAGADPVAGSVTSLMDRIAAQVAEAQKPKRAPRKRAPRKATAKAV